MVDAYQMWDVRKIPSDDTWLIIEGSLLRWFDDDVVVIDDDYSPFTCIWHDVNGFVSLLGDITYA